MSTRCAVDVFFLGARVLKFYHHHDGYPGYMVNDLAKIAKEVKTDPEYGRVTVNAIEKAFKNHPEYEEEPIWADHGDLEWRYELSFNLDKEDNLLPVECETIKVNSRYVDKGDYGSQWETSESSKGVEIF